jgi:hypothetical protein
MLFLPKILLYSLLFNPLSPKNTDSLTDFIFGKRIVMSDYEFFRNIE